MLMCKHGKPSGEMCNSYIKLIRPILTGGERDEVPEIFVPHGEDIERE